MYLNHAITVPQDQSFLFCRDSWELDQLERDARAKLSPRDNGHRAAKFADGIVEIVRRRHRHIAGCSRCLVAEALTRR